eukprot:CAMPEP_0114337144 /NCGR_PEP_ID=MMETSP0101-20121206/6171_1 /TAXON_ID=38822 ORGANISM="Pteridomonas danica, Strain PT" /NCGR_SAMPLE_ID=MMETSP0101 /ASSEMBLY_ACC=CAM_ASM_000211 /LENGTH=222 /DNA_ID=CAMNT_0001469289 /DNA_START=6 /DNA_END=674 /DNA_ORIENTATION=+
MAWRKPDASADGGKTSVPGGLDSTFFGSSIPVVIRRAVPLMHAEAGSVEEILAKALALLKDRGAENQLINSDEQGTIFTALQLILSTAIRSRTKASVVEKDLKSMNVPEQVVVSLVNMLKKERMELESRSLTNRTRFPRLEDLQWRADVAISSSSLLRVFRPCILMQISLSDGRIKTFDVPVDQFHQLRYNVAKVLRDMQELERHPIMRIADEASKKTFEEK